MEGDDQNEKEPLSTKDKAIILGLEEIIEELKSTNELMQFNNDNITNFREEMDALREEIQENITNFREEMDALGEEIQDNSESMSRSIGSPSMQMNNTVIAHLASIRTMIFWALFGLPLIAFILMVYFE